VYQLVYVKPVRLELFEDFRAGFGAALGQSFRHALGYGLRPPLGALPLPTLFIFLVFIVGFDEQHPSPSCDENEQDDCYDRPAADAPNLFRWFAVAAKTRGARVPSRNRFSPKNITNLASAAI